MKISQSLLLAVTLLAGISIPAEAARYTVAIQDMAFGKAPTSLQVGDTVVWQNKDILRHSATARGGSFDIDLAPGSHGEVTLKQAGQVQVFCRYHPTMKLTLTVAKGSIK